VAAVVGAALVAVGVVMAVVTAVTLTYAAATGGTEGLKKAVFSPDTFKLAQAGDLGGAIGSGSVDIFNTVDSLIPIGAGVKMVRSLPKLPSTVAKAVSGGAKFIEGVKNSNKIRVALADTAGLVSGSGKKIVQQVVRMTSGSGSNGAGTLAFLGALGGNKGLQSEISRLAKEVDAVKGIKGGSVDNAVKSKAAKIARVIEEEEEEVENLTKLNHTPLTPEHYRKMPLNWSGSVPATGQSRIDHIKDHGGNDLDKKLQGVFHKDPVKTVDYAWSKKGNMKPITQNGRDIYHIPYKNVGFQGGINGTYKDLNFVTIVTKSGTNELVTAYPSYGK
jgi:hypothetical protein